jgi:hypothetical protein
MKHLSTPPRIALLLISTLLAASSCQQKCGLAETGPPLLGIAFSTDTLGAGTGFHKAEALSAYLVRYKNADLSQPLDTVRTSQRPGNFYYVDRTLFCNFPASAGPADPHSYRLLRAATISRTSGCNMTAPLLAAAVFLGLMPW